MSVTRLRRRVRRAAWTAAALVACGWSGLLHAGTVNIHRGAPAGDGTLVIGFAAKDAEITQEKKEVLELARQMKRKSPDANFFVVVKGDDGKLLEDPIFVSLEVAAESAKGNEKSEENQADGDEKTAVNSSGAPGQTPSQNPTGQNPTGQNSPGQNSTVNNTTQTTSTNNTNGNSPVVNRADGTTKVTTVDDPARNDLSPPGTEPKDGDDASDKDTKDAAEDSTSDPTSDPANSEDGATQPRVKEKVEYPDATKIGVNDPLSPVKEVDPILSPEVQKKFDEIRDSIIKRQQDELIKRSLEERKREEQQKKSTPPAKKTRIQSDLETFRQSTPVTIRSRMPSRRNVTSRGPSYSPRMTFTPPPVPSYRPSTSTITPAQVPFPSSMPVSTPLFSLPSYRTTPGGPSVTGGSPYSPRVTFDDSAPRVSPVSNPKGVKMVLFPSDQNSHSDAPSALLDALKGS